MKDGGWRVAGGTQQRDDERAQSDAIEAWAQICCRGRGKATQLQRAFDRGQAIQTLARSNTTLTRH